MMSDSGDTDILLEIPPDFFAVPSSSESVCSSDNYSNREYRRPGVILELVGHMQTLESRISAIESKDNSLDATLLNNSLESYLQGSPNIKFRQTLPRPRLSISQNCSLQNTPVKPCQSKSYPSTPIGHSLLSHANTGEKDMRLGTCFSKLPDSTATNIGSLEPNKHDIIHSNSCITPCTPENMSFPHVSTGYSTRNPLSMQLGEHCWSSSKLHPYSHDGPHSLSTVSNLPSSTRNCLQPKPIHTMDISEVDELLQEMEATELELSRRINSVSSYPQFKSHSTLHPSVIKHTGRDEDNAVIQKNSISKKLEFQPQTSKLQYSNRRAETFPDISLPSASDLSQLEDADRIISEFKSLEHSMQHTASDDTEYNAPQLKSAMTMEKLLDKPIESLSDLKIKDGVVEQSAASINAHITSTSNTQMQPSSKYVGSVPSFEIMKHNFAMPLNPVENSLGFLPDISVNIQEINKKSPAKEVDIAQSIKSTTHASTNTEQYPRTSQKLLSLSDFWDHNTNKSPEEVLRIKLEEEQYRREHCEHLIQELQKRLLEQQEKVAVALRVDDRKNDMISQLHIAWSKLKERVRTIETEHENLQTRLKTLTEKHQTEVSEHQSQIKRCEGELSKALDLAAGYKEKNDESIKEKVDLLKSHADELESYKSLVQEAEKRYDQLKEEYRKLSEKNQQTDEILKNLQQELNKERLRNSEVRNEMNIIHKALDTCEAELMILRQEKDNLQLKLKEEVNRNAILEQKNLALMSSVDEAKKAEKLARDETKTVADQKEKIRAELQEVYQKQVDEVVKVKLQEFQTQLDAAESEFLEELKTRQQVIAECAARKIKDIMDKHRLEVNLLEEKHKEEKRLYELQLGQAVQKSSVLEAQLNSHRTTKSQLAEQLHSVMQKQWQQALQIISGSNMENLTPLQRIHVEKFFDSKGPKKSESLPNCYGKMSQEPTKLISQAIDAKNFYSLLQRDEHNETRSTMTPIDDTPLTSRKESKEDLRKYMKMMVEMQQPKEDFTKVRESISSPPLTCREVPRKHYLKKELSIMSEDSVMWQAVPETALKDSSEFLPIPQKIASKAEQQKFKPPWK